MDNNITSIFDTPCGEKLFDAALNVIEKFDMKEKIREGVLVGLSGGADSVLLLYFLLEYRRRYGNFSLLAVHVNHMIRGEEADRDERFAMSLCDSLGVQLISRRIDVPSLAKERGVGIEECARDVRYSVFGDIISGRNDISTVAVAHNSTDNAETVIFNMLRGAGSRGIAGIPPVRDNVIRPLISVSKTDISSLLDECGISYVLDSTNLSCDYTRNYIRREILPTFTRLCSSPEDAIFRMSSNLRLDDRYLYSLAEEVLEREDGSVSCSVLRLLDEAIFARVLTLLAEEQGVSLSHSVICAIRSLVSKDNFTYTLPGGAVFVAEYGRCRIDLIKYEKQDYLFEIKKGKNELLGFGTDLFLAEEKQEKTSLNVYKISIQVNLRSAIINGRLILRPRRDGDTVFYGGMTHKLKKLYNDRKIPRALRSLIPVLCDDKGIVWVPGFGVRDDGVGAEGEDLFCCLCIGKEKKLADVRMYSASEFSRNPRLAK